MIEEIQKGMEENTKNKKNRMEIKWQKDEMKTTSLRRSSLRRSFK